MLGFYPEDSVVLIAIQDGRVQICARLDTTWMERTFDYTVTSLRSAVARFPHAELFLLGYTGADAGPEPSLDSLELMESVLGAVSGMYLTNGSSLWDLDEVEPEHEPGTPWNWSESQLAATAVFHGITVSDSREQAVAAVSEPEADHARLPEACERLDEIADPHEYLAYLLEREAPIDEVEACQVALLLNCEGCGAALLARMTTKNAGHYRERLAAARRCVRGPHSAGVIGVLGVACWLDGQGTIASECLMQLHELDPCHPLTHLLRHIHEDAIPPKWWGDYR